ncbi:MAG: DUF763 domain-containing protein [Actinobacteria bacterium]|nr:DUF763 domain-containing protein [Actinomycetota bacterium]
MKTGTVNLPLHGGKAPAWLFSRMTRLSREILMLIASEYGPVQILERISDPNWFQALGCVLGFDWHSSGVTTTVCGALKESLKGIEKDIGLYIAGGKGGTSRKTPAEIKEASENLGIDLSHLVYNSKITAKVDNNALQDGYQLYHHCFFFTKDGKNWAVIQQGMNEQNNMARRYHWLSSRVSDFVCEPHSAICCDMTAKTLNLIDNESELARKTIAELSGEKPEILIKDLNKIKSSDYNNYTFPSRHHVSTKDIDPARIGKILLSTYERKPENFETLLSMQGVGPKTIRSLALISELIYGVKYSIKDPVRFSFAHGGKDGIPYPVDRENYDRTIEILYKALKESKIERTEKINAIKRLSLFYK